MELWKEILIKALSTEKVLVTFPNLKFNAVEIVNQIGYQALQKIKAVIDDSLTDAEWFMCIERNHLCI